MIHTFKELLASYCAAHGKTMEKIQDRDIKTLSRCAALIAKDKGHNIYSVIVSDPIKVNSYDDCAVADIEAVIDEFFADPAGFRMRNTGKVKRFLYDVKLEDVPAFEAALKFVGLPVQRNEGIDSTEIEQYMVPSANPYILIKLGKAFIIQRQGTRKRARVNHKNNYR